MFPENIATVDFETYYDDEYTLKKIAMTDYIWDDRFEVQSCAIKVNDHPPTSCIGYEATRQALSQIDWSTTGLLGHHTQFDGLIATHHFGVYPSMWLDTMSMGRAVLGTDVSVSLKALCARLGRKAKVHAGALDAVKNVHACDLTPDQAANLLEYNEDDVEDTWWLFGVLRPYVPEEELALIDLTIRMYAEPVLLIDGERVARAYKDETERKDALFSAAGIDVKSLGSAPKFARCLETLGVRPPRKTSLRTGKSTWAFSKQDHEFISLLQHHDERVRTLMEARLASKSTLVETRSSTILGRVGRPTPIYLNYWGARTGRWSGGDGANWQNLPKKGIGQELRKALCAPQDCLLIVADAAQAEARILAWHAGQDDIVDAYASGQDVYALAAAVVYGRPITQEEDPAERFLGKVLTLGAGYGAGCVKINYMLKIGAYGPPVIQSVEETGYQVDAWRAARPCITRHWRTCMNSAKAAFLMHDTIDDGVVCFEGTKRGGYIHLPNGTYIHYPNVHWDDDKQQMVYVGSRGPVHFWHGLVVENITQGLARVLLGEQMLMLQDEMPDMRIVTTTHDEVLLVVPKRKAEVYASNVQRIFSTSSKWAQGLPLNAETQISLIYEKH